MLAARWLVLPVLLWLLPPTAAPCLAGRAHTRVNSVSLDWLGGHYSLETDIAFELSGTAVAALNNGVPLFWDVHVKIHRPRHMLWDKTLLEGGWRFRLQYHALLDLYRVSLMPDGKAYRFSSLDNALAFMSSAPRPLLLERQQVEREKRLLLAARVVFDRSALPLPLRPFAYFNRDWDLSSDWTQSPWPK